MKKVKRKHKYFFFEVTPRRPKIKRTVYFTSHPKMLKYIENFAHRNYITVSSATLGFIGIGLLYEGIEGIWRDSEGGKTDEKVAD